MTELKPSILAVDDEIDMLETYTAVLSKKLNLLTATSGEEALTILKKSSPSLVLLDIRMPKEDGLSVLKKIKKEDPNCEVIMVTASRDVAEAVEAMKLGTFDYITKPFEVKELLVVIEKALEKRALIKENLYLKDALAKASLYCDLIGKTPIMQEVYNLIDRAAPGNSRVLITGESGTGKELVARAIHNKSKRSQKPFVAINCAALPEQLLESLLFGYEKGAFTGALERKIGKFELAEGGTLFLDEIGCLPAAMQAKLLRAIQEKQIDRIGGNYPITVDVRIIAATNIDFKRAIEDKTFRDDLYYRLNVIPIQLPPLRKRKEDIPLFLDYFINQFRKELNRKINGYTKEALSVLNEYNWPGNVRELQNIVERIVTLSQGNVLTKDDFERALNQNSEPKPYRVICNLSQALLDFEKECILSSLENNNWNRSHAARELGVSRTTLLNKMDIFKID